MNSDCLYIVLNGSFVSQKTVVISHQNFWPVSSKVWKGSKIGREVLFTANKIEKGQFFGEKELMEKKPYGINICSAEENSQLLMFPKIELVKCLSDKEI